MTNTRSIEIRCPNGPKRLFSKLRVSDEDVHITPDNLIEFACSDCKRTLRREGFIVDRVLHQYNFVGELVDTFMEY